MNRQIFFTAILAASLAPGAMSQESDAAETLSSGARMVASFDTITHESGGRIGLIDGVALAQQLDELHAQLETRAAEQDGDWDWAFGVRVMTSEPEADPCDTITPARMTSRRGVRFDGQLCVLSGEVGGLPFRTQDWLLQAPLNGQPIYVRAMTRIEAADADLLADSGAILTAMARAVIADMDFIPEGRAEPDEGVRRWTSLLNDLSLQTGAYINFPDLDALSEALDEAADTLNDAADRVDADWGVSFRVEASERVVTGADRDWQGNEDANAGEPSELCAPLPSVDLPDWTGQVFTWVQCGLGPRTEGDQITYALRMSRETGHGNARGSVAFAMGTATDTAEFRDTLTEHAMGLMHILVSGAVIRPTEPTSEAE